MSLLTLVTGALLKSIEAELVNHAPELQALALSEFSTAASMVSDWVDKKLNPGNTAPVANAQNPTM